MGELGMFGGGTCLSIFTGHGCLSGQQLQNSDEGDLPNLIGWVSEEAGDRYQLARKATATAIMEAKTPVWEEFREAIEKDFQLTSKKLWQMAPKNKAGLNPVYAEPAGPTANMDWRCILVVEGAL